MKNCVPIKSPPTENTFADELVLFERGQALPVFVVYFKESEY